MNFVIFVVVLVILRNFWENFCEDLVRPFRRGSTDARTKRALCPRTAGGAAMSYGPPDADFNAALRGKKVRVIGLIGEYVRLVVAPKTCRGIIADRRITQGSVEFLFHHDERFERRIADLWVLEAEIEMCPRPTDAEVKVINMLEKRDQ